MYWWIAECTIGYESHDEYIPTASVDITIPDTFYGEDEGAGAHDFGGAEDRAHMVLSEFASEDGWWRIEAIYRISQ